MYEVSLLGIESPGIAILCDLLEKEFVSHQVLRGATENYRKSSKEEKLIFDKSVCKLKYQFDESIISRDDFTIKVQDVSCYFNS